MHSLACGHELAALHDHLCADCIIEHLYQTRIVPIREILFGGVLNQWR